MTKPVEFETSKRAVWPSGRALSSWSAILASVIVMALGVWSTYTYGFDPLERLYLPMYVTSAFGSTSTHSIVMLAGAGKPSVAAMPADVDSGTTYLPGRRQIPVVATAPGKWVFLSGPTRYRNKTLHAWLLATIYGGVEPWHTFIPTLAWCGVFFAVALMWGIWSDRDRTLERVYGRHVAGTVLVSEQEFKRRVKGDGIGIMTYASPHLIAIPRKDEDQSTLIAGASGSGKSTCFRGFLRQIADRGEVAVVNDPSGEFKAEFFDSARGDVDLNPLLEGRPAWSPQLEVSSESEAHALAASLYQPSLESQSSADGENPYFLRAARDIFAHLVHHHRLDVDGILAAMRDEKILDKLVHHHEVSSYLSKAAGPQRGGVQSTFARVSRSMRLLPAMGVSRPWSAQEHNRERKGWVFLTGNAMQADVLRPLYSMWLDLLIMRAIAEPHPTRRMWMMIDELPDLQVIPKLHTGITTGRKARLPFVLGMQSPAQMVPLYGEHFARAIMAQPKTRIILRLGDRDAKWGSEIIGEETRERMPETFVEGGRKRHSHTRTIETRPLVIPSRLMNLEDRQGFLRYGNYAVPIEFPPIATRVSPDAKSIMAAPPPRQPEPLPQQNPPTEPDNGPDDDESGGSYIIGVRVM